MNSAFGENCQRVAVGDIDDRAGHWLCMRNGKPQRQQSQRARAFDHWQQARIKGCEPGSESEALTRDYETGRPDCALSATVLLTGAPALALIHRMRTSLLGIAVALAAAATIAFGQTTGETEKRGSIPIGTSQDGSGPSDGAIIGGSTERLEVSKTPERAINRCKELIGALQEECFQDLGLSATSAVQPADAFQRPPVYDIYADPRRRHPGR